MQLSASFSVVCPFFDLVAWDINDVRKEKYPKVNAAYVDSG
jgi:hypothetical protein